MAPCGPGNRRLRGAGIRHVPKYDSDGRDRRVSWLVCQQTCGGLGTGGPALLAQAGWLKRRWLVGCGAVVVAFVLGLVTLVLVRRVARWVVWDPVTPRSVVRKGSLLGIEDPSVRAEDRHR